MGFKGGGFRGGGGGGSRGSSFRSGGSRGSSRSYRSAPRRSMYRSGGYHRSGYHRRGYYGSSYRRPYRSGYYHRPYQSSNNMCWIMALVCVGIFILLFLLVPLLIIVLGSGGLFSPSYEDYTFSDNGEILGSEYYLNTEELPLASGAKVTYTITVTSSDPLMFMIFKDSEFDEFENGYSYSYSYSERIYTQDHGTWIVSSSDSYVLVFYNDNAAGEVSFNYDISIVQPEDASSGSEFNITALIIIIVIVVVIIVGIGYWSSQKNKQQRSYATTTTTIPTASNQPGMVTQTRTVQTGTTTTALPQQNWKLCPNCALRNKPNNKFCQNCGSTLQSITTPTPTPTPTPRPTPRIPEDVQISEMAKKIQQREGTCTNCGSIMSPTDTHCSECGAKRSECPICKRRLNFGDDIGICFFCESEFHYGHLLEHVKIKGTCPVCRQKLLASEVMRKYQTKK